MMEVASHQVIHVVPVRCLFMTAVGAVSMLAAMPFALMVRRAGIRVRVAYGKGVFIDVIVMHMVQVTIMEIVGMPVVAYRHVPATGTMNVTVGRVRSALTFFHIHPF
jgi:hypothetical protein